MQYYSVRLDGSDVKTILKKDLETVDGLAVDWIANNIYLTDAGRNVIEVCRLDGSSRKILVDLNLDEPRAIAVHPIKGFMFWSDWGENPKIERSFLDGSNRKIIVSSNLAWPNDLSIDYKMKKLYWADAKLDKIEYSDFNGKNRRIVLTSLPHPFGLTMDDSHIYWTDWKTKSIEKADKLKGQNRVIILSDIEGLRQLRMVSAFRQSGKLSYFSFIFIYNISCRKLDKKCTNHHSGSGLFVFRGLTNTLNAYSESSSSIFSFRLFRRVGGREHNKGSNPCELYNGGCSHLCLYRPQGYICACPTSTDDKVPCSNVPGIVTEDPLFWTSKPTRRTTSRFHLTTPSRPQQQHVKIGSGPGLENNTSKNGSCADERCSPDSPQPPMSVAIFSEYGYAINVTFRESVTNVAAPPSLKSINFKLASPQRRKRVRSSSDDDNILTFSNPTYNANGMQKKSKGKMKSKNASWAKYLKKEKNGEKFHELSSSKLNNLEAAALVSKNETSIKFDSVVVIVPPAPPKRVDSTRMNNFYSPSPLDSDSQLQASSPNLTHKIRTNKCVETDI
ncbi:Low-density lipoprotein receptor-related protein 4 [Nymphon striatum]|nr:Low-density lipoprotein receptor-related protein 4 [Nymphon striatum]